MGIGQMDVVAIGKFHGQIFICLKVLHHLFNYLVVAAPLAKTHELARDDAPPHAQRNVRREPAVEVIVGHPERFHQTSQHGINWKGLLRIEGGAHIVYIHLGKRDSNGSE